LQEVSGDPLGHVPALLPALFIREQEFIQLFLLFGVAGCCHTPTLDKTMHDRTHLVSADVEKLLAAIKGTRHETRDRCWLLLMFRLGFAGTSRPTHGVPKHMPPVHGA
jgi:hypothetical protein